MTHSDLSDAERMERAFTRRQLLYPNERVVAFFANYYGDARQNTSKRGLDVGCGSGRHLNVMMDYGIDAFGVDFSQAECDRATALLRERGCPSEAYCGDFYGHYEDGLFDVVLAFGVLFLRETELMRRDLRDLHRILRDGGRLFANFRTQEDSLYGLGEKIGERAFRMDERAGGYRGLLYTFLSREEGEELLTSAGFAVEKVERTDFWKNNLKEHHSWWEFSARKQGA